MVASLPSVRRLTSGPQLISSSSKLVSQFCNHQEVALGGTFTIDLMAGVLGAGDDCMAWGLALLVCCEGSCCRVASLVACLVLSNTTVHGGQCAPAVVP